MTIRKNGRAWRAAADFGFDMSLIAENLRLTPAGRIERHRRALFTLTALTAAGRIKRDA